MIITRTPFRISFFGGGTDYPAWFQRHGGAVIATSIDKYCHISCRHLPPFFEHRHRIVYSKIENVKEVSEIMHPAVRGVFQELGVKDGLEIHHDGDLPARSGIGSSSAFTVGLLNALYALNGRHTTKEELASRAIYIEQSVLRESVGSQDQVTAAFGGFNHIEFMPDGSYSVRPILMLPNRLEELQGSLMLFFTGLSRTADAIAKSKIDNMGNRGTELGQIRDLVAQALAILTDDRRSIGEFGRLLDVTWKLKRGLSDQVSTAQIDRIYEAAISAGALGGKLLGAGGGGFVLFFVPPARQAAVREALSTLVHVPFKFDRDGSRVVLYQPDGL